MGVFFFLLLIDGSVMIIFLFSFTAWTDGFMMDGFKKACPH